MQTSAFTAVALLSALAGFLASLPLSAQTTITFEDGQPDYTDVLTTTVADPLTLTLADGAATQSGPIGGNGSVTKTGDGTLTLTNANTYTGGTTITGGAVQIGGGGTQGSIVGDVLNNWLLTFNRSNATEHAGVVSGSGSVTHAGTGTLTLTAANTYEGGTSVIGGGLLQFTTDANLGTGNITLDNGGLKWAAGNTTDVSARLNHIGSGGGEDVDARGTFDTNGNDVAFNAPVTGIAYAVLEKTGTGTLTLNGGSGSALDYHVSGGTLTFATGAYEGRSLLVSDADASDPLSAAPTAVVITGAGTSFGLIDAANLRVGDSSALSASLTISDGASFSTAGGTLIGSGSTAESTLTVTGAGSSHTSGDFIRIGEAGSSGRSSFIISDGASATTWDTFLGVGSTGDSILTVSGAGSTFEVVNALWIGQGPGYELITGSSSMTVSGGASVSAGWTVIGGGGALGANSLTLTDTGSKFTNIDSLVVVADRTFDNGILNLGSAAGDSATAAGILDAEGVTGGDGVAILQFNTTGTDLAPTYFTRDGTGTGAGVYIGGSLSLVNTAGTTVLTGANNYTGVTRINGGTLVITESGGLGSSSDAATNLVLNGGTLRYLGGEQSTDRLFQVGDTTAGGTGTLDASGTGALTFTNTGSVAYGTVDQTRTLGLAGSNTDANTLAALIADNGTGAVNVVKSGTGTWVLSGTNTYSGGTVLNDGLLGLGADNALGSGLLTINGGALRAVDSERTLTNDVTLNGDFTLGRLTNLSGAIALTHDVTLTSDNPDFSEPTTSTLSGVISGAHSLTFTEGANPVGTLVLAGDNTYTGGTIISGGNVQIGDGDTHGSIVGDVLDHGSLTFNRSDAITFAGVISGSGSVTQAGSGTLTLTGTNTYAGGTSVVNRGMIEFSGDASLGTGNITLNKGGLKWAAGNTTDISSRLNALGRRGAAFDTNGNDVFFASAISGEESSELIKTGAGTLTLSGATGENMGFFVGGGTLDFGTGAYQGELDIGSDDYPQSNGPSAVILSGADTSFGATSATEVGLGDEFSASLTISGGASFSDAGHGTYVGQNSIAESTLTVTGAGSTYTGSGELQIGSFSSGRSTFIVSDGASATARDTSLGYLSSSDSILTITGPGSLFTTDTLYIGRYLMGGQLTTHSSAMTVSDGASASAGTTVIGSGGAISANSLTLTGTGSTFTTGTLTLAEGATDNGTLNLGSAAGAPATAAGVLDAATVTGGLGAAILQFNTTGTDLAPTYFTRDGTRTGTGVNIAGGLALVNTAGTTVLTGTNTYSGGTTITGGLINFTALVNFGTGNITLNGGGLQWASGNTTDITAASQFNRALGAGGGVFDTNGNNVSLDAVLSGTGALTKTGAGTLRLGAANTYSGGTFVTAGTLGLGAHNAVGIGAITITGGGIRAEGQARTLSNALFTSGTITVGRSTTFAGVTTLNAATTFIASNPDGPANANTTFSGPIGGNFGVTLAEGAGGLGIGTGYIVFSGTNTYTGGTTLRTRLSIASDAALGAASGALTMDGGTLRGTAAISSARNVILGADGGTLDMGSSSSFSGTVSGSGALTKSGAGTLTLSGANTYTGATAVNAGTLRVNGSLANTAVTVASGATLGGSGMIGGHATFESGAHLGPGNSPGTITFAGGLTLSTGSILDFQLGTTSDLIVVSGGTLTGPGAGTITVNLTDSGGFTAGTYTLIDATGATLTSIGATSLGLGATIAGYDFTFAQNGDLLQLTAVASAVPEPASCAALLGAAALAFALRRKRRPQHPVKTSPWGNVRKAGETASLGRDHARFIHSL